MNTKILLTASSVALGAAGLILLFAPEVLSTVLNVSVSGTLSAFVQLLGGLYLSHAWMNWASRESRIGGIYGRPVSLANFSHFMIGTFTLGKLVTDGNRNPVIMVALVCYAVFVILFWRLIFVESGIEQK